MVLALLALALIGWLTYRFDHELEQIPSAAEATYELSG